MSGVRRPRDHGLSSRAQNNDVFRKRFILTDTDETRQALESLLQIIEQHAYDTSSCFAIRLALEEALSNAFKHGNRNRPGSSVTLECRVDEDAVVLEVQDQGEGFDPAAVPDPTEEENLEIPSGRGIVLMHSFMSSVEYDPPGNRVRMTFDKPSSA